MKYEDFSKSIDCNFPYDDVRLWKKIIHQSAEIGEGAPFVVLHEICRVPLSKKLSKHKQLEIYNYWKAKFGGPVQKIIEPACLSFIDKTEINDSKALEMMRELIGFPGSYIALQLVLYSCPDDDDVVSDEYDKIVKQWQRLLNKTL
ncbi:hypothetical protein [Ferrimonas sediminum]|uniref:hypothetical protein n=1 Tax=Ferrimonas sediminum TaxID=718193 RepID=UPI000B812CB4|nr:hypothetical protein [Ferrimonas sediminum]